MKNIATESSCAYYIGHVKWPNAAYITPLQGFGFAEVEQLYGLDTIRNATDHLRNLDGGRGKLRMKLFISVKGIKLFDYDTMVMCSTIHVYFLST